MVFLWCFMKKGGVFMVFFMVLFYVKLKVPACLFISFN